MPTEISFWKVHRLDFRGGVELVVSSGCPAVSGGVVRVPAKALELLYNATDVEGGVDQIHVRAKRHPNLASERHSNLSLSTLCDRAQARPSTGAAEHRRGRAQARPGTGAAGHRRGRAQERRRRPQGGFEGSPPDSPRSGPLQPQQRLLLLARFARAPFSQIASAAAAPSSFWSLRSCPLQPEIWPASAAAAPSSCSSLRSRPLFGLPARGSPRFCHRRAAAPCTEAVSFLRRFFLARY
jgi:hypothetical protein